MKKMWRFFDILAVVSLFVCVIPIKVSAVDLDSPPNRSLIISAANFDNDLVKNPLGEFIEIKNMTSEIVSLSNVVIKYKEAVLVSFAQNSFVKSDGYIVLKNGENFKTNLSMESGELSIEIGDTKVDEIEWTKTLAMSGTGKNRGATMTKSCKIICETEYSFDKNYVLHEDGYFEIEPVTSNSDDEYDLLDTGDAEALECDGLMITEIYSYFEQDANEQFVELFNSTTDTINVNGCQIWIKYGGKYQKFSFGSTEIAPNSYFTFYPNANGMNLAKDPSGSETILLLDDNSDYALDSSVDLKGQKKAWSFALIGDLWVKTMSRTPNAPNVLQVCAAQKIINPATGKCVGITEDEELPECGEGKFRNPETNRCKSYATLASTELKPCQTGYYRNELTNRCNKIVVATSEKPCQEGYERNPETNRCRKIRENDGTEYGVEPIAYNDKASFIAWGAAGSITALGSGYTVFQFRQEMWRLIKKTLRIKSKTS